MRFCRPSTGIIENGKYRDGFWRNKAARTAGFAVSVLSSPHLAEKTRTTKPGVRATLLLCVSAQVCLFFRNYGAFCLLRLLKGFDYNGCLPRWHSLRHTVGLRKRGLPSFLPRKARIGR